MLSPAPAALRLGSAAELRVAIFAVFLAGVAAVCLWANPYATVASAGPWTVPGGTATLVAVLVVAFALAEGRSIVIAIDRQSVSVSLWVIPLFFGLLLLPALLLVIVNSAGVVLGSLAKSRIGLLKLLWNLAKDAVEIAVAALIVRYAIGPGAPSDVSDWVAVFAGLALAEFLGLVAVPVAIMAHSGEFRRDLFNDIGRAQIITLLAASFLVTAGAAAAENPLMLLFAALPLWGVASFFRSHGRLQRAFRDLEQLHRFTLLLERHPVESALDALAGAVHATDAAIVLPDELGAVHHYGRVPGRGGEGSDSFDQHGPAMALRRLLAVDLHDATVLRRESGDPAVAEVLAELHYGEALVAPLEPNEPSAGLVVTYGRTGSPAEFTAEDVELFQSLARALASKVVNQRLRDRDRLTGLPNREAFIRTVAEAVASRPSGAIVQLDLIRFREVNDSLGHAVGDKVLAEIADRLRAAVRSGDLVARLGGDEFAVLMVGDLTAEVLEGRVQALLEALRAPVVVDDITFDVRANSGAARWPEDGDSGERLLRRADIAVNQAKRTDADFMLFRESFDIADPRRLELAAELRAAIDGSEIDIHLQPKVDLTTGRVVGAEALARWTHPQHGIVPPAEFIPLVEQSGLAGRLTRLVVDKATMTVAELARLGLEVPVGVNLATRDLLDPSLPGAVDAILAANGVEPRFLEVEITEGVMVVDFHTSVRTLNQLRRRGIAVAVDDFGTGYSSLTYLHKLPLDSLKIDRSFTNRLRSERSAAAIVRASIRLAHDLGLSVVAEGVEDEATLDRLTALGCDQAQGYLLARPMPARDFLDWMIQHHGYALPRPPLQGSLGGR